MKHLMALASGLILATGLAFAGGDKASFDDLDKDGNGAISRTEAAEHEKVASSFDDADTNGDGQLSESEFSAVKSEKEEGE
jgi:hypothetical protein